MAKPSFLHSSLAHLIEIAGKTHNEKILPIAITLWQRHLNHENPLWKYIAAWPFSIDTSEGSAHVMAMIDPRLPGMGLVGHFACSKSSAGAKVLSQAVNWLREKHGISNVYGPINGTITSDYRLNLEDDFCFPGEPVNPQLHIDAFRDAGFLVFNRYVSGIAKHFNLLNNLFIRKPSKEYAHLNVRQFDSRNPLNDLKIYHDLMNAIFPSQSIYCPVLTWEERVYNMAMKDPIFDSNYTYFLEDKKQVLGFIVAYPYEKQLILKTIGLLPEHQGKGLSGLLIKKVHDQAKRNDLKAAIYAMIRVGNTAYKMKRPGIKVYRKYITMYKNLRVTSKGQL